MGLGPIDDIRLMITLMKECPMFWNIRTNGYKLPGAKNVKWLDIADCTVVIKYRYVIILLMVFQFDKSKHLISVSLQP